MKTIEELRRDRGWSQPEMARRLVVNQATVFNWERGKYEPSAGMLRRLAELFGVSMDDIDFARPARERRAQEVTPDA